MADELASIARPASINREDAQRFLGVLDDRTDRFTFQLFDDDDTRKDRTLARTLHGTLNEHYPTMVEYSRRGAGVFVTINSTNFKGRSKECIVKVRSYFADLDGASYENTKQLGLSPHMVTETSPGRYHVFYLISHAPSNDETFKSTQQKLAKLFDSDPKVCDLPRVMRLPGFPHQKDPANPFITRILYDDNNQSDLHSESEFQHALSNALAAREPASKAYTSAGRRRRLLDDALAWLPSGPPDWSKGYAEGERNNECARRAGSCFGRGMTEAETLAECLQWNRQNNPPLPESEVEATVASIGRSEAKKHATPLVPAEPQAPAAISEFVFDGDANIEPPKMLVKKLLPASGVAFIGGQSSAGKTFVAVALGVALASGTIFFQHRVKERVGVLYIAAEGAPTFPARVAAAKLEAGVKGPIPFAWTGVVPSLRTPQEVNAYICKLQAFGQEMQRRCGVRLGTVVIDTVAACFSLQDENSNAEVSRVCASMRHIGDSIGVVVVPVHHYGKDAGTGLRGASAFRGAADVVISVTADIDQTTGRIGNRGLAVAKARDGEQGQIAPFRLEWVKLGTDEDGEEFGSLVVRADAERGQQDAARNKASKGIQVFDSACRVALGKHSEDVQLSKDGPKTRAVELKHVRAVFCSTYVTGDDDDKKAAQTSGKAWQRALEKAPKELPDYATSRGADGREWLWLKTATPGRG